jgi:hypothetical protein|tara:strand:- start:166 stop:351 length:186 start_codon:yes stop_codon:yes gene_type:complete
MTQNEKKVERYAQVSEARFYMTMAYQLDDIDQVRKVLERGLIEIDEYIRKNYCDYWYDNKD